jgi:hypothetical protein
MNKDIKIENLAAIKDNENSKIIGYLTWYSVAEAYYNREELLLKLTNVGLEGFMPRPINPADAFRRATKAIERRVASDEPGIFFNFIVRNVASDNEIVQRNIVKETVDSKGKKLSYSEEEAVFIFNRKSEKIDVFQNNSNDIINGLIEETERLFEIFKDHHDSQAVRVIALNILKSMSPTPVRPSGGVYFVPAKFEKKLRSLCKFLSSFENSEGIMMDVINKQENRDMIRNKLNEHLRNVLGNCHHTLRSDSMQKGQVKLMIEDAKRVINDYKEYINVIGSDMNSMDNHVELIRQSVQLMLEKI